MQFDTYFFYLFSFILVVSGFCVVFLKNPIHSVLCLVVAFFNAAGLFILLQAEFLAFVLAIVYIGAIAILFLFIVMFLNIKDAINTKLNLNNIIFIAAFGILLFAEMLIFFKAPREIVTPSLPFKEIPNIQGIAISVYSTYAIAFIIAGFILLVGMIGAMVLAYSAGPKNVKHQSMFKQTLRNPDETIIKAETKLNEGVKIGK